MSDKPPNYQPPRWAGATVELAVMAVAATLFCGEGLMAGDPPIASAAEVKAVFLFNFTKYVDWPPSAFLASNAPIIIGVIGTDPFGDSLQHDVDGKTVNGRTVVIKHFTQDAEWSGCQILFISHSEASRAAGILAKASLLPILTVGEDEAFAQNNGVINFVIKNGNVRLEIDLAAARKAGLTVSSRLLAVADSVKGKSN